RLSQSNCSKPNQQREHEPAHMLACTLQRRPILLSCFCSLSVSLIQHRQLLDSSSDLPCLIVSCDLSCEISDTQTDACAADGTKTDRQTDRQLEGQRVRNNTKKNRLMERRKDDARESVIANDRKREGT
uniref:Uncharacterized protein n=1 Tax=Oreochromis aureus TaxID=47969 RepID=A0A668UTY0_OREAU